MFRDIPRIYDLLDTHTCTFSFPNTFYVMFYRILIQIRPIYVFRDLDHFDMIALEYGDSMDQFVENWRFRLVILQSRSNIASDTSSAEIFQYFHHKVLGSLPTRKCLSSFAIFLLEASRLSLVPSVRHTTTLLMVRG